MAIHLFKLSALLLLSVISYAAIKQDHSDAKINAQATEDKPAPKLHADILTLMDVSGMKPRLQAAMTQGFEQSKAQIAKVCPNCAPAFAEEWSRRMHDRLKVDDFVQVSVKAYEKYLTDDDVTKLIAFLREKKSSPQATLAPELSQKLNSVMPSLMADTMAGCTRISTKLGAEVGSEIEKEHPEYMHAGPHGSSAK